MGTGIGFDTMPSRSRYQAYDLTLPKDCNGTQEGFLNKAAQVAFRSNMAQRHGCVVVLNGEIISSGFNHRCNHMFHRFSCHSEVDALRKIKRNMDLSAAEMYVVRIGPESAGNPLRMSMPCEGCTRAIVKAGIGRVYYSWSEHNYHPSSWGHGWHRRHQTYFDTT